jgi:hypothetical protein
MKDVDGKLQYKGKTYRLVFNLNVMESIQAEYGTLSRWGELTDGGTEPDAKAVLFGITEMINEGIDMDNEENGTDEKFLTKKQVGRMLTDFGLAEATQVMNDTVIASAKSEEKNE